jgi:hypothetical protein
MSVGNGEKMRLLAGLLSLVLSVATIALWIRSHRTWDAIDWHRGDHRLQLRVADGILAIQRSRNPEGNIYWCFLHYSCPKPAPFDWSKIPGDVFGVITDDMIFWDRFWWVDQRVFQAGGFAFYRSAILNDSKPTAPQGWALETPLWFWFMVISIFPFCIVIGSFQRKRRFQRGACVNCGYDLRATPDRCPECGKRRAELVAPAKGA